MIDNPTVSRGPQPAPPDRVQRRTKARTAAQLVAERMDTTSPTIRRGRPAAPRIGGQA